MSKHTPGPWKAGRADMATLVNGVESKWIYAGDKYVAVASGLASDDWDEVMANARLIARAPEMAAEIERLTARVAELEGALTPSAETKAAYIGEFHFTEYYMDEDGNDAWRKITVPWDTVKEIMAAIRARAALTQGERTPSFGDFVEGCDYLPVPSTKGESHD